MVAQYYMSIIFRMIYNDLVIWYDEKPADGAVAVADLPVAKVQQPLKAPMREKKEPGCICKFINTGSVKADLTSSHIRVKVDRNPTRGSMEKHQDLFKHGTNCE